MLYLTVEIFFTLKFRVSPEADDELEIDAVGIKFGTGGETASREGYPVDGSGGYYPVSRTINTTALHGITVEEPQATIRYDIPILRRGMRHEVFVDLREGADPEALKLEIQLPDGTEVADDIASVSTEGDRHFVEIGDIAPIDEDVLKLVALVGGEPNAEKYISITYFGDVRGNFAYPTTADAAVILRGWTNPAELLSDLAANEELYSPLLTPAARAEYASDLLLHLLGHGTGWAPRPVTD
jgi:hypothetical protein